MEVENIFDGTPLLVDLPKECQNTCTFGTGSRRLQISRQKRSYETIPLKTPTLKDVLCA
jgi:hypothetical protein